MTIVLSPEQLAILAAPSGPLRIDAGAGTGKTFTLVRLVAEWVTAGTPPERILGITFTNKAAAELASRIRHEVASALDDAGMEVDVHTYHGFAGRLLAEFGPLVGIERGARILTPPLARQLIADCFRLAGPLPDIDLTALSHRIEDVMTLANDMSDNLVDPETLQDHDPGDEKAAMRSQLARVVGAFNREKRRLGVIDYGDMIAFAHRLVTEVPGAADRIRERYDHVLLDEYQDTAPAQRQLLQALFADGMTVVAVGDADQTIYEWRGASLENFAGFPRHFPDADGTPAPTLPLTVNRRSGQQILDVANAVRARASDVERLPLVAPDGTPPGRVTVGRYRTALDEAAAIADLCVEHHCDGIEYRQMAVLVRRNRDIARIREALADAGVPAEVATLGGLLEVPEVVDLHAWLRILDDPGDTVAFARLCSRFRLGLADLKPLAAWVNPTGHRDDAVQRTHVEALDHLDRFELRDGARSALARLREHIHRLTPVAHASSVVELVRTVLGEIDAWRDVEALTPAQALSARLNLYRFLDLAQEWSPLEGQPTLTDFLGYLEVLRSSTGEELETARISGEDTVTLLTVHRAKGLEWDVVFLPALADGVFPGGVRTYDNPFTNHRVLPYEHRLDRASLPPLATIDPKLRNPVLKERHLAGEWRLGYVAVTRARQHLHASTAAWYGDVETTKDAKQPSKLLDAIAEVEGVERIADHDAGDRPDTLKVDGRATAPDAVFESGWDAAVRATLADPSLPRRLAEEFTVTKDFETELAGFQGLLFSLPEAPEVVAEPPAPAVSVSGLVTWAVCPRRFHHAYVDPLPRRPNPAAMRGVAVHRRIELHNLGRVPLEEADGQRYDTLDVDSTWGTGTPDDTHDTSGTTDPHGAFLASRFATDRPIHVEVPFELRRSGGLVRGRIDAIYGTPSAWEIVDFKSGRPHDDPSLDVQLDTYAVAARAGAVTPTIPDRVRVTFAYLGGGLTERSWVVDDERLEVAQHRIDGILDGIVAGEAEPTPGRACVTCDFLVVCPEGQAEVARLSRA